MRDHNARTCKKQDAGKARLGRTRVRKVTFWLKGDPGIGILHNIMRLSKLQLEHLSYTIARGLIKGGYVIVDNREQFRELIRDIIAREQQTEMSRANVHYHEMFRMVKAKLAEQEGVVL